MMFSHLMSSYISKATKLIILNVSFILFKPVSTIIHILRILKRRNKLVSTKIFPRKTHDWSVTINLLRKSQGKSPPKIN